MKTWTLELAAAAVLLLVSAGGALAQTAVTGRSIEQRKDNQQQRIAQGVASGQLTSRETSNLERREASVNREERQMRRANGGTLTAADKAALTQRQNRISRSIYVDKHNAAQQR